MILYPIAVPYQPTLNSALPPYLGGFKSPLTPVFVSTIMTFICASLWATYSSAE